MREPAMAGLRVHPYMRMEPRKGTAMPEPLIVNIPHRLGKDEALRRIKDGIGRAKGEFSALLAIENESWDGDALTFSAVSLGQRASGTITVYDSAVRLEVTLPWLLARFAHAVQRIAGQRAQLMLEKK
jgi:hypothetical protein